MGSEKVNIFEKNGGSCIADIDTCGVLCFNLHQVII